MKTKTMTITKWSVLALAASVLACELPLDQLEVGDEMDGADEGTGTDSSGDGDGDGDGDGEALLECIEQGTNLAGGDEPIDFPLPECEVVCASGWGHDVAPLANEWTLEQVDPIIGYTHLEAMPTGELVAVIAHVNEAARLVWVSPDGELLDELTQPAINNEVWGVAITDDGNIVALSRQANMAVATALSSKGEHLWTVELGAYGGSTSVLAALGSGVVVALNSTMVPDDGDLLYVDSNGVVMELGSIPPTEEIAVSPSGNTVVIASSTTLSWMDVELFPSGTSTQGVVDVSHVAGLVALDDERVVIAGDAENLNEGGSSHAFVEQIGPMGLEWEGRYDRALEWCADETDDQTPSTVEHMMDVERLADGSLFVVGAESAGGLHQPWVGHVSAQGEVLATDRGFWSGAAATVTSSQGAAYVLLLEFDEGSQTHTYLRKYLP
jgi:hypothetical protein